MFATTALTLMPISSCVSLPHAYQGRFAAVLVVVCQNRPAANCAAVGNCPVPASTVVMASKPSTEALNALVSCATRRYMRDPLRARYTRLLTPLNTSCQPSPVLPVAV